MAAVAFDTRSAACDSGVAQWDGGGLVIVVEHVGDEGPRLNCRRSARGVGAPKKSAQRRAVRRSGSVGVGSRVTAGCRRCASGSRRAVEVRDNASPARRRRRASQTASRVTPNSASTGSSAIGGSFSRRASTAPRTRPSSRCQRGPDPRLLRALTFRYRRQRRGAGRRRCRGRARRGTTDRARR